MTPSRPLSNKSTTVRFGGSGATRDRPAEPQGSTSRAASASGVYAALTRVLGGGSASGESGSVKARRRPRSPRGPRGAARWLVQRCPRLGALLLAELFVAPRSRVAPLSALAGASQRELRVGRRRVRLHLMGEGPLIVLLHGWQGGASQLVSLAESLRAAGFRVALFDMPAHGEAPGWSTSGVEFVSILERVAAELGPLHAVVGHSLGGAAAVLALARGVPMAGAVAVAPLPSLEFAIRNYARAYGLSPAAKELLTSRLESRLGIRRADFDLTKLQLTAPALLVHDRLDRATPARQSQRIVEHWPRARYLETLGLGHNRILDAEDVAHAIVEFACSLPGAEALAAALAPASAAIAGATCRDAGKE